MKGKITITLALLLLGQVAHGYKLKLYNLTPFLVEARADRAAPVQPKSETIAATDGVYLNDRFELSTGMHIVSISLFKGTQLTEQELGLSDTWAVA